MGVIRVGSLINDQRSSLKRKSMINESLMEGKPKSKVAKIKFTDAMADKAMQMLSIPESFRKCVLWLAWNRSEARFWELVEAASADGITSPGRYFIASISQERRGKH